MAIICQILFCFVHCKRAADLVASRRLGAALDMKAEKIKVLLNVLSIDRLLANRPLFNESPGVFDMTGCPPLRRIFFHILHGPSRHRVLLIPLAEAIQAGKFIIRYKSQKMFYGVITCFKRQVPFPIAESMNVIFRNRIVLLLRNQTLGFGDEWAFFIGTEHCFCLIKLGSDVMHALLCSFTDLRPQSIQKTSPTAKCSVVVEKFLEIRRFWVGEHGKPLTIILTDAIIGVRNLQLFPEVSRLQVCAVNRIAQTVTGEHILFGIGTNEATDCFHLTKVIIQNGIRAGLKDSVVYDFQVILRAGDML